MDIMNDPAYRTRIEKALELTLEALDEMPFGMLFRPAISSLVSAKMELNRLLKGDE
jgi:hypothetical protein